MRNTRFGTPKTRRTIHAPKKKADAATPSVTDFLQQSLWKVKCSADDVASQIIPTNIEAQNILLSQNLPIPIDFTSVGYEFEFAQLPEEARGSKFGKSSHLTLAQGEHFPLFPSIPFAVETDMSSVIELAMPPLLTPKKAGGAIDGQWLKTVLLKLERGLKALAKSGTYSLENLLLGVQQFLGLNKPFQIVNKRLIVAQNNGQEPQYGYMQKNSTLPRRFTNGQANVVTTLKEAIELAYNRIVPPEIASIQALFQQKLNKVHGMDPDNYGLFIAQKISEIPYMFFDMLHAESLQELKTPPGKRRPRFQSLSTLAGHPSSKAGIHPRRPEEEATQHTARKIVSRVKDRSTGWIKTTLEQQIHLFSPKIRKVGIELCHDKTIQSMLQQTAAYEALNAYAEVNEGIVEEYNLFVGQALNYFRILFSRTVSPVFSEIKEQEDHPELRSRISSARPDTVVTVASPEQDAVLVEIRKATEAFGINADEGTTNQPKKIKTIQALAEKELALYEDEAWVSAYISSNPFVNTYPKIKSEKLIFYLLSQGQIIDAYKAVLRLGISVPEKDTYWSSWFSEFFNEDPRAIRKSCPAKKVVAEPPLPPLHLIHKKSSAP